MAYPGNSSGAFATLASTMAYAGNSSRASLIPDFDSWQEHAATRALMIAFNLLGILGNLIVVYVIPRIPEGAMNGASKVHFIGLSIADMMTSTIFLSGPVSAAVAEWVGWSHGRETFCKVMGLLIVNNIGLGLLHIMLLNTERYLSIMKPLIHPSFATTQRALIRSVIPSILQTLGISVYVFIVDYLVGDAFTYQPKLANCTLNFHSSAMMWLSLTLFASTWSSLVVLVFQYGHIIYISLQILRDRRARAASQGITLPSSQSMRNFRTIRTPVIITGLFSLSFLPITSIETHRMVTGTPVHPNMTVFAYVCIFINGILNPFIYFSTVVSFRHTLKKILKCH